MENAADALKMAAAVLMFVLALSISINAFGEVRQTSQIILDSKDREYEYGEGSYVENNGSTQRVVGLDTIVPSIYKAYKENYKIVFTGNMLDNTNGLYQKKNEEGNLEPIKYIDLEKEVLGSDTQKERFIMAVLYGADTTTKNYFVENLGIYLNEEGIYDIIQRRKLKFTEKLGIYYQDEIKGATSSPETNKVQKRVVTYEQI